MGACKLPTVAAGASESDLPQGEALSEEPRMELNPTEIEIFLRDSTLSHQSDDIRWHVYLGPDGTLTGMARGRDRRQIQRARGRWEVTPEGLLCRQWEGAWGGGTSGCARVFQEGSDFVFVPQGAEFDDQIRRRRSPGDAENIL